MTDITESAAAPPEAPPPERYPVWGWTDLLFFIGLAIASMVFAMALASMIAWPLRLAPRDQVFVLVPAQFLGWLLLFLGTALLLRSRYGRPFWNSLGWTPPGISPVLLVAAGVGMAFAVAFLSVAMKTPDINSPMKEYLSRGATVVLIALFGTTVGPLCEELAFRGFMQPLFVRTFGAVAGVLLAALPFGLLHLPEYNYSWRHGLLITAAGAGFGWMRYATRSLRSAVVMHIAYNCTFFVALVVQRKDLPHSW